MFKTHVWGSEEKLVSVAQLHSCCSTVQHSQFHQPTSCCSSEAGNLSKYSTATQVRCCTVPSPQMHCCSAQLRSGTPPLSPTLPRVKPIYPAGQLKENSTECRQPIMYGLIESRMSWVDRPTQLHTTTIQKTWLGNFLVWYDLVQRYDVGPRKTTLSADMVNVMVLWVWYDATP